jgi:hypothetical protein
VLSDLVDERGAVEPEQRRRSGSIACAPVERVLDDAAFDTLDLDLKRQEEFAFVYSGTVVLTRAIDQRWLPGENALRHVLQRDQTSASTQERPNHRILQFPEVSRPFLSSQRINHPVREARKSQILRRSEPLCEILCEDGYIFGPLSERRDVNSEHVQSVEQILTKAPLSHELVEIAVGRCHDAYVGFAIGRLAHRRIPAMLKDAQQLGLLRRRHFSDFVK